MQCLWKTWHWLKETKLRNKHKKKNSQRSTHILRIKIQSSCPGAHHCTWPHDLAPGPRLKVRLLSSLPALSPSTSAFLTVPLSLVLSIRALLPGCQLASVSVFSELLIKPSLTSPSILWAFACHFFSPVAFICTTWHKMCMLLHYPPSQWNLSFIRTETPITWNVCHIIGSQYILKE